MRIIGIVAGHLCTQEAVSTCRRCAIVRVGFVAVALVVGACRVLIIGEIAAVRWICHDERLEKTQYDAERQEVSHLG